jgi:hypothetical protein
VTKLVGGLALQARRDPGICREREADAGAAEQGCAGAQGDPLASIRPAKAEIVPPAPDPETVALEFQLQQQAAMTPLRCRA